MRILMDHKGSMVAERAYLLAEEAPMVDSDQTVNGNVDRIDVLGRE